VTATQGRRESEGGQGKGFMHEAHKNIVGVAFN